ncbi:hypothetical protein [Lacticaseibacillus saniviri]
MMQKFDDNEKNAPITIFQDAIDEIYWSISQNVLKAKQKHKMHRFGILPTNESRISKITLGQLGPSNPYLMTESEITDIAEALKFENTDDLLWSQIDWKKICILLLNDLENWYFVYQSPVQFQNILDSTDSSSVLNPTTPKVQQLSALSKDNHPFRKIIRHPRRLVRDDITNRDMDLILSICNSYHLSLMDYVPYAINVAKLEKEQPLTRKEFVASVAMARQTILYRNLRSSADDAFGIPIRENDLDIVSALKSQFMKRFSKNTTLKYFYEFARQFFIDFFQIFLANRQPAPSSLGLEAYNDLVSAFDTKDELEMSGEINADIYQEFIDYTISHVEKLKQFQARFILDYLDTKAKNADQ